MTAFLVSLLPFAAFEITSWPRMAILAVFLGAKTRPIATGIAFVAGTLVCYMVLGILFSVGLGQLLQNAGSAFADRIINPENIDYVISLILGIVLLVVAVRLFSKKKPEAGEAGSEAPEPESKAEGKGALVSAFLAGVGSNAIVGPNTLVSFGAFAQILKAEFSVVTTLLVLVYYNLIVIAPLAFLVWLSAVNPERAERFFGGMRNFFGKSGKRALPVLCLILGLVMVADSVGYFFGHPLLPTGSRS